MVVLGPLSPIGIIGNEFHNVGQPDTGQPVKNRSVPETWDSWKYLKDIDKQWVNLMLKIGMDTTLW